MYLVSPVRPIKHLSFNFINIPGDKLRPRCFIFSIISLPILLPLLSLLLHHFQISSTFVTLLCTFIYKFAHLALVHVTRTLIAVWKWNKACQIAQETGVCHFLVSGYLKCKGKKHPCYSDEFLRQSAMSRWNEFPVFWKLSLSGTDQNSVRRTILSYICKYNWFFGAKCTRADWIPSRLSETQTHIFFFNHRRMKCI